MFILNEYFIKSGLQFKCVSVFLIFGKFCDEGFCYE